jgi:L-histidine Nalpha-methyltransferase
MYLVSLKRQSITVGGERFDFAPGEPVHTEDSYKYTIESFREMATRAGFSPRAVWTDEERLFSVHWLETR